MRGGRAEFQVLELVEEPREEGELSGLRGAVYSTIPSKFPRVMTFDLLSGNWPHPMNHLSERTLRQRVDGDA